MKTSLIVIAAAGTVLTGCTTGGNGWLYGNQVYATREECLAAKRDAQTKGAVVGAVGGAATGAVLGGNVGEAALASGVGAAGGAILGGRNRPC
ncbi:MAG: hypothetical protein R6W76_08315 [Caldilinea sp.]